MARCVTTSTPGERGRRRGGQHEADIVEGAPQDTLVGGDVGPHADHAMPSIVSCCQSRLRYRRTPRLGKVGRAGDDRDVMPGATQARQCSKGARGRRIDLGREVVGQEQDVHISPTEAARCRPISRRAWSQMEDMRFNLKFRTRRWSTHFRMTHDQGRAGNSNPSSKRPLGSILTTRFTRGHPGADSEATAPGRCASACACWARAARLNLRAKPPDSSPPEHRS